jgi:ribonucleoside-diphosphate reductase alpha chain
MYSLRVSRSSRFVFEKEIGFIVGSQKNDALHELNTTVKAYTDHMTDRFVSLTLLGEQDVYDLTEPLSQHFIANGISVHNCSEYMFLDDTACNLASLNLMKFRRREGSEMVFDIESFKKANEVIITAMEIAVGNSSYPTPAIEQNSYDYRPLGIGYANLGALLMSFGLPYDSEKGRNLAAVISSLQSGHCYYQSSKIAENLGSFPG